MGPYSFILKQRTKDGAIWTSPESFGGDAHEVRRTVLAGYLAGEPRWAETLSGMFLFGVDSVGRAHYTGTACAEFSE
jgi:hypothetical protein